MQPAETVTTQTTVAEPTADQLLDLHTRMVRIRHFEEEAGKLTEGGKIPAHCTCTSARRRWLPG